VIWIDLVLVIIGITVGMWAEWYLLLRRPFPLHILMPAYPPGNPQRQIVSMTLPVGLWRYANGNAVMQIAINDDGQPPPPPPPSAVLPPPMMPQPPV
jgi:hypothetical protein